MDKKGAKDKPAARKGSKTQQDAPDKNLGQKRKSSGVKHIEKLEKDGHLYKSKESKTAKKPSLPPKSKEQEDFELLSSSLCCDLTGGRVEGIFRKLQNLWRRINAGYIISRRKPQSLVKESFAWVPEEVDEPNRENMHLKDGFSEYAEALARASNMYPKKKREPIKFVSAQEKAILRAQMIQKMKDENLKADLKLGIKKEEPKKKESKGK